LKNLRKVVDPLKQVVASCSDLEELAQMADEDPSLGEEISSELLRLEQATEQLEIRALLSGPNDDCGAILSVNAREGGLDANDWAEMLLGMYTAWAQQNGYSV
ncbi:MAG: PCRF domain-containing protein, partial [Pirellula sp.]